MLFLWNVASRNTRREIRLQFYDSVKREVEELRVDDYYAYILALHPLSEREKESVESIRGEAEIIQRRNLFTNEMLDLTKVKAWTPTLLKKLRGFRSVWESEIEYGRSYIYDRGLVFGAPYTQQGQGLGTVGSSQQEITQQFVDAFSQEKAADPLKYEQIQRWFYLCHQPVPDVDAKLLGAKKREDINEEIYLAFMLARIANIPIPEAFSSKRVSDWLKSMIYTYLRSNCFLIPTSVELRKGQDPHRVSGALTIEPEAGVYFGTVVCDFESLYPSCIDRFNLSYETVDCLHKECEANRIPETGHHVCTRRRGFYSLLIGALKDLRIRWFKPLSADISLSNEERSMARAASKLLKLISVSGYGVTVRIRGVACPPLAESITGYGRWALQTTWDIARRRGMHPIYGDTDSIFLNAPSEPQVQALIDEVKRELNLDLAREKGYSICVLSAAKKAYFGITEKGAVDLKGLTAIKSNAPNLIQQVFRNCVEVLSGVKDMQGYALAKAKIANVVNDALETLRARKVNLENLTYSVRLYHEPSERTSLHGALSQPYQCALQLINAGERLRRGDTVHFIKVKPFSYRGRTFTVKPLSHVKSLAEINVENYARNLETALQQTFEPMNILLKKDMKLTDWFKA